MVSRKPFYLLVALLYIVGLGMTIYHHIALDVPLTPGEKRQIWSIEAKLEFEEKADTRLANARKYGVEGLMGIGVKNADIASKIYTTQVEQAGAMARTQVQTAASDPLAVMRALSVPGPMRAGYEFMQQAKGEPMTKQKLFLEYMKNPLNDPAKFGEYVQQYERQFGPIGSSSGSASQSADTSGFRVVGVRNP